MLVLSRKPDQEIHVPQYGIKFRVLGVDGKRVRIGIDAPADVRIIRNELAFEVEEAVADCMDPNYVWPLGVRFEPNRLKTPFVRGDAAPVRHIPDGNAVPSYAMT